MSAGEPCQNCGHLNSGDAMFCSKCGTKMRPISAGSAAISPDPEPPPPAAPSEPPPPMEPRAASEAPAARPPSEPPAPEPPRREPASSPPERRRVAATAKTMIGIGKPDEAAIEAAKEKAAETRARKAAESAATEVPSTGPAAAVGQGRTMLGMPAPQKAQMEAAIEQARSNRARSNRGRSEPPAGGAKPEAAIDPLTNRTMLGQPAPKRPEVDDGSKGLAHQVTPPRARAPVIYPTDTGEELAMTLPITRPARGLAIAALVFGLVILAVGGGALAWSLFSGGSELRASVVQGDSGEMLEIEVPGAEPGSRLRFGGEERELEAGRARFPLSAEDLSIGHNDLSVDIVGADGSVQTRSLSLQLEMRVRADLGALSNAPPAIDVVVEAPAGSEVTLDGEALALDGHGRGTRRFTVDQSEASAAGVVEHVVRYRIHPPDGEAAQGELRTHIPLTTMQLDRPGVEVVTDRESIEFAGAVAPGSTITVGGQDVAVTMGRFLHTHALPALGEHTVEVVARAPGRAPLVSRVRVRRVSDLAAEAESFEFNRELTYARVAQHPTTFRGQTVRFDGLVYNVDIANGRSVLQILVTECPEGERCPLWVTYSAATEAELRSRVRVLGTVAGEQQFRSQSGQVRTVPRVDATFVLPLPTNQRR